MRLNEKLLKLRNDRGLKQYEVAGQIGVNRKTIIFWEQGKNAPDMDLLIALARLYGASLDELLSDEIAEAEIENVNVQGVSLELPFREKIFKFRSQLGLTQREMAAHLDVSYTALCRWETGERQPGTPALVKLSKLLGIPIDELLYCEMRCSGELH